MLCRACIIGGLAVLLGAAYSRAAQQPPEEKVVVTANAYPVPFENLSRAVAVITRQDIEALPAHSIADVLALSTSIDLRPRSPFGLQTDISIRGSAYSQTLILVDGIRVNDAQTGHHNADFPVQLQDVERIEVLLGPGSSIYGADAFGGIVNIITRRGAEALRASVSAGDHGLVSASVSTGFRKGRVDQSLSAAGSRSSGFDYDRDFRTVSVSARTGIGTHSSIFVSHVNKEFGASGFYGPSPSREWTNQTFISAERSYAGASGSKTSLQGYYRTHGDRFLYDQRSPGLFESRHRTHSSGAIAKARYSLSRTGSVTFGGELGGDWIVSNTLGNHSFVRSSAFTEFQWIFGKTAAVYPGFRLDHYSNFGTAASPSISGSWWVARRLRLRASAGKAFRIPTFTELYYHDPNNEASASLTPETAWSADLGGDFIPARSWMGSVTLFSRWERNVIDWVRMSSLEKWRTANMRRLHTQGAELSLERSFGPQAGFSVHYSRISADPGRIGYISKYVLDYARDAWSASAFFPIPHVFTYRQTVTHKKRSGGQSYWLLDGKLEHEFRLFAVGIDCTNLLNSRYQEVAGVNMPGRWFTVTIRTR